MREKRRIYFESPASLQRPPCNLCSYAVEPIRKGYDGRTILGILGDKKLLYLGNITQDLDVSKALVMEEAREDFTEIAPDPRDPQPARVHEHGRV
jgi:hypothetical protein